MNDTLFNVLTTTWILIGFIMFVILLFIPAPYGRHRRKGWGLEISNKAGWILMELPSLLFFSIFFLSDTTRSTLVSWIFFSIWVAHYVNRSLIYPLRTKTAGKKMPLVIAGSAVVFNFVNGSLNGIYFSAIGPVYDLAWLTDPRFMGGLLLLVTGVWINVSSDQKLLRLRKENPGEYQVPKGGLYERISCPNFFGEILEWTGFAIMTWSYAALAFALWTAFNLIPRALDHHRWYRKTFTEYPGKRKAIIPWVL